MIDKYYPSITIDFKDNYSQEKNSCPISDYSCPPLKVNLPNKLKSLLPEEDMNDLMPYDTVLEWQSYIGTIYLTPKIRKLVLVDEERVSSINLTDKQYYDLWMIPRFSAEIPTTVSYSYNREYFIFSVIYGDEGYQSQYLVSTILCISKDHCLGVTRIFGTHCDDEMPVDRLTLSSFQQCSSFHHYLPYVYINNLLIRLDRLVDNRVEANIILLCYNHEELKSIRSCVLIDDKCIFQSCIGNAIYYVDLKNPSNIRNFPDSGYISDSPTYPGIIFITMNGAIRAYSSRNGGFECLFELKGNKEIDHCLVLRKDIITISRNLGYSKGDSFEYKVPLSRGSWNEIRLLWIGKLKNIHRECPISLLPVDMIKVISDYVMRWQFNPELLELDKKSGVEHNNSYRCMVI